MENCCSEFPASVFSSSFSMALLQRHTYYCSIVLSPPTKCLPQNLPLSICSPLGKEMEGGKRNDKMSKRRARERAREKRLPQECLIKASYRQRPRIPLGRTHSHSQQTNASSLTHTHTHYSFCSCSPYTSAYIKVNYLTPRKYVATHL